ncbi:putative mitochondrial genome maintenance exonuclease 1 [Apostichopus japonicus]|uniref:Mitochondrial genome maintenance exonuclease 1 n=1 Tax=Stichopus japonicus TaxID=307972 RepID=A0A2G8K9J2_STIJA|nr:putative mitochondrial genome maintenance exonuclease 1 [Apostichopus japonicus]
MKKMVFSLIRSPISSTPDLSESLHLSSILSNQKCHTVTRLFSKYGKNTSDGETLTHVNDTSDKERQDEASTIITKDTEHERIAGGMTHKPDLSKEDIILPGSHPFHVEETVTTLNSQLNSTTASSEDDEHAIDEKAKKKKKKKPESAIMKVIRDKKMLERYRVTSKRRKGKTAGAAIPTITTGTGYKDQLLEYISRQDETLENVDGENQFAVSKSGKVMMFPLTNSDFASDKLPESSSEDIKVPSVTTILHVTRPMRQALALMKWENRMIKELGEDGFKQMKQEMFAHGHSIHRNFEQYLKGTFSVELDLLPATVGFWESCSEVLPRIQNPAGFEIKVKHPALSYSGYIDCIAEVDGKLALIELKTSRKPKLKLEYIEDYALQAAAYLGALNFDPEHNFQVKQIVIVVVYKDGMKGTIHTLDEEACHHYWIKWLGRLLEYQEIIDMKKAYVKRKIIAWSKTKAKEEQEEEKPV